MPSEDVMVETVHESERRDGKKNNSAPVSDNDDNASAQDTKKRLATSKANPTKDIRGQGRKRAA
jgi:hypothetical protein